MLQMPIQTFHNYQRDTLTAREQLLFPYCVYGRTVYKNTAAGQEEIATYKDREVAIQRCHGLNIMHSNKIKAEIAANEVTTNAANQMTPDHKASTANRKRHTIRRFSNNRSNAFEKEQ